MPFYEVEHCIPLNKNQRDDLAKAITHIHSRKFTTPSLFVNIRFTNSSEHCNYVAGKEVHKYSDADKRETLTDCLQCVINRVIAHVRAGGSRTKEDFDDLTRQILDAWNQIVKPDGSREKELKRVFVIGAITTGMESGFFLPKVSIIFSNYAIGIILTGIGRRRWQLVEREHA